MDTTPEGLIRIPSQPERGGVQGLAVAFVLGTFALILVGTAAIDLINPLEQPKLTGGEKTYYLRKQERANWQDGSLARLVEYEYRIRSRIRSQVSQPYADFMYRYFKEGNSKILVGDDGWLFFRPRVGIDGGPDTLGARRSAAFHGALSRRFGSMGIRHIFMPLPRKSVIYGDFLPMGAKVNRAYDAAIVPAMRRNGVETLDLLGLWGEHAFPYVYRQTDTHWSTEGMKLTAQAAASLAGFDGPEHRRLGAIRVEEGGGEAGGMYSMMGVTPDSSDEQFFSEDMLAVELNGKELGVHDPNSFVALCGTSFCSHDTFGTFVSHFFGQPVDSFASPGKPSCASLLRMLDERSSKTLPSLVLNELPNHYAIKMGARAKLWTLHRSAGKLFSAYPPMIVHRLNTVYPSISAGVKLGTPIELSGQRRIAHIKPGVIAHSGGGVVEVEIEVELQQGTASLLMRSGHSRYTAPLVAGRNRVVLPILLEEPGSNRAEVLITASSQKATFLLESVNAVSAVDKLEVTTGNIHDLETSKDGWHQDVVFPSGTRLQRHSAIILTTSSTIGETSNLRLEVSDIHAEVQQVFEFSNLLPGGLIIVDPGLLCGRDVGRVRLIGTSTGDLSAEGIVLSAEIYDQ